MDRKNYILVDFENGNGIDLGLLKGLNVEVHVFLGLHQPKLDAELVEQMLVHADKVKLVRVQWAGPNALDFVLACAVGRMFAADPNGYYHVVSKDKGFDALVAYLREVGGHAARHEEFRLVPIFRACTTSSLAERTDQYWQYLMQFAKNRPAKRKAMLSSILAHFAKQLTEPEGEGIIATLQSRGVIKIDGLGKVTYSDQPKKAARTMVPASSPKPAVVRLKAAPASPTP